MPPDQHDDSPSVRALWLTLIGALFTGTGLVLNALSDENGIKARSVELALAIACLVVATILARQIWQRRP